MPRPTLTKRQRLVLDTIKEFIRDYHVPPTIREIGEAIGTNSPNGAEYHLNALVRLGYIGRHEGMARGIWVK